MLKDWEKITNGYFNREHPYTLPIFDDFGLDEQDNYYYDTASLSKSEGIYRNANKQRLIIETVADNVKYGNAKTMYMACPITSGLYASEWIADRNKSENFDPAKTIKTTHKLGRHMGTSLMGQLVTGPNVRDNLMRGAIAFDHMPDHHPLMPVVREMVVKHMTENPDYSGGQKYEDVDFMAKWYIKIDNAASLVMDGPLTFSRSTDKEIMRALLVQSGLHPSRPEADMDINDINGDPVDTIDVYSKMYETLRYQVGSGIHPKESLTVLLRMNDIFDHLQGKENKISAAREAAGMDKFPENMHPSMQKWITDDAKAFAALRDQVDTFAKTYGVSVLSDKELSQLDDKYQSWKNDGYGQMPSYADGMSPNLRKKLEICVDNTDGIERFFQDVLPHKDEQDGAELSLRKAELVEMVQESIRDFNRINTRNNGHWNPRLEEIRENISKHDALAVTLDGASPSNHERLVKIALEIKETAHNIKNQINSVLNDTSVADLRAESRLIAKTNLDLAHEVKSKPVTAEATAAMRRYNDYFAPFANEDTAQTFNDHLFDTLSAREQAGLTPTVMATETVYPAKNSPYTARVSIDPKAVGSIGNKASEQDVSGIKNVFGAAGSDSEDLSQAALDYANQAMDYVEKMRPGKMVHGTPGDAQLYSAIGTNPAFVAKKGGGYRWSSAVKLLNETKFTQMRDDEIFFGPGWERSEHQVQERVNAVKIQLGLMERDHGSQLKIYSLPEDLSKAPANIEPDSLLESIVPIARFVDQEFEAGRMVPPKITLGLIRLCEIHAMIEDPSLTKRLPENERFNAHQIDPSLIAYMRDERKNLLGNNNNDGLYKYLCDRKDGLLVEPAIIRHVPASALEDPALGTNYAEMQKEAQGKHANRVSQRPSNDLLYVDIGLHA